MKRYRIIFFGTPKFSLPSLEVLLKNKHYEIAAVVTQADKPAGRGKALRKSPVKERAEKENLKILQPEDLESPDFSSQLKSLKPDLGVVVAYGKILPQEILDIFPQGSVNIHGSFLPRYRGASPIAGAILAGEKETGVTLMKITLKMDAGPIIAKSKAVEINRKTTGQLSEELAETGAKLLEEKLLPFLAGELAPQMQNESEATYVRLIRKEEAHLNFQKEAKELEREIRAYNPWPVSFFFWGEKQVKIYETEISDEKIADRPGKVGLINREPAVQTSKGSLVLKKLQLPSKKPVNGKTLLAGYPQIIGSNLT